MKRILTILALMCLLMSGMSPHQLSQPVNTDPPADPVRLIFIHHSTGGNWLADPDYNELGGGLGRALMENNYYVSATNYGWGPDSIGDATDIPNWLDWFHGERSGIFLEALYNEGGQNFGDFGSWPRLADAPAGANTIIVFKSCFPNSDLEGSPNDPPTADGWLTVGHAKYVYNEILKYFLTQPDKLFVVVTAPPLSSSPNAKNARAFNNWLVNDWLDLYPLTNVAVFDFYNVLTGPDNHHRVVNGLVEHAYKEGQNRLAYPSGDDHPSREGNRKATAEFVPILNAFYNRWQSSPRSYSATDVVPGLASVTPESESPPVETQSAGTLPEGNEGFREDFEDNEPVWEAYSDEMGASSLECAASDGNAASGNQALRIEFDVDKDGWGTCSLNFPEVQSWSAYAGLSFQAWVESDGVPVHVDVFSGSADNRESYYYVLEGVGGGWTEVSIPWQSFKRVDWEENAGQPLTNTDQILGIAFGVPSQGKGILWVDDLHLVGDEGQGAVDDNEPAAAEETDTQQDSPQGRFRLPFCSGAAALPLGALVLALKRRASVKN